MFDGMEYINYDIETTGLQRLRDKIFSFAVCDEEGKSGVHRLDGSQLRQVQSKNILDKLWADESSKTISKVMHNAKLDFGFTEQLYPTRNLRKHVIHDTMIMSHLLQNNHPSHALDDLAWELADYPKGQDYKIKPYTRGGQSYQGVPEHLFNPYQVADVERGMLLFLFFYPKIQANKDWLEIYGYERDVIPVTIDMENRGMIINKDRTLKLISKLRKSVQEVLDEIKHEAKLEHRVVPGTEEFRDLIFNKMKFPIIKLTKTKRPKLGKDELKILIENFPNAPILKLTQKYKSWSRGVSTLTGYIEKADDEGALHPNIRTLAAITGRESCVNPSLMNVEDEDKLLHNYPVPARTCFQPRRGYVNFHLDFSGQEMRILIHYSGDQVLVDCANGIGPKEFIRKGEYDVHMPAVLVFYPEFWSMEEHLQKQVRESVKNGNFAKAYGAGWPKLIPTLGIESSRAFDAAKRYEQQFPKLCSLMPEMIRQVKDRGYIETAFGRRIHVPREEAYMAVNYEGQGTAAEQIKRAQVKVDKILKKETSGEAKLLLPIHDELILEWPRRMLGEARPILRKCTAAMVDFGDRFKVPFKVEVEVATYDWQHKTEYSLHD
jgi:DNA polymerase-1